MRVGAVVPSCLRRLDSWISRIRTLLMPFWWRARLIAEGISAAPCWGRVNLAPGVGAPSSLTTTKLRCPRVGGGRLLDPGDSFLSLDRSPLLPSGGRGSRGSGRKSARLGPPGGRRRRARRRRGQPLGRGWRVPSSWGWLGLVWATSKVAAVLGPVGVGAAVVVGAAR